MTAADLVDGHAEQCRLFEHEAYEAVVAAPAHEVLVDHDVVEQAQARRRHDVDLRAGFRAKIPLAAESPASPPERLQQKDIVRIDVRPDAATVGGKAHH